MRSGLPFSTLVRSSQDALKKLGYPYTENDIGHAVELVVGGLASFTIRIRLLGNLPRYNPLLGGLIPKDARDEVDVAILLGPEEGAKGSAARFVGELMSLLPREPWKGLGLVESFTAKSLWKRWAAGLEER